MGDEEPAPMKIGDEEPAPMKIGDESLVAKPLNP